MNIFSDTPTKKISSDMSNSLPFDITGKGENKTTSPIAVAKPSGLSFSDYFNQPAIAPSDIVKKVSLPGLAEILANKYPTSVLGQFPKAVTDLIFPQPKTIGEQQRNLALGFVGGAEGDIGKIIGQIAKSTEVKVIEPLLLKLGISEEVIPQIAERLKSVSKPEEVNSLLNQVKQIIDRGELNSTQISPQIPNQQLNEANVQNRSYTSDLAQQGKYVKNEPINFNIDTTDKTTARNIREEFTGVKNAQIVRGNQLAGAIKKQVPDLLERQGMFWFKAAQGDTNVIQEAIANPKFAEYKPQLEAALKLSPKAENALQEAAQYYGEAGNVSKEIGTIHNIRENYQNRIYQPEPPKDFVKTEVKTGLRQTTGHARARVFDTEFQAVENGKKFATTDIADALSIHNEEMARVNTSRKLADTLQERGLGAWKQPDNIPDGWEKVGTLEKNVPIRDAQGNPVIGESGNQYINRSVFVAPKGIAKGLEAIADPNFTTKIDTLRGLQKYQGLIKTVDLSYSFFHHFTMAMQTLYQGTGKGIIDLPVMSKVLDSPEFKEIEQDFVRNTGITAKVSSNQDILRNLTQKNPDFFSRITNLPIVKQVLQGANKSSDFLFEKMQRLLKVQDYGGKISNWIASHSNATNEEVTAAKKGFAKEINAAYGGLNWEAMGMTKSNLSLLRLILLAPDWTISNLQLVAQTFRGGTTGSAARAHYIKAIIVGMVLTEGVNKILTGHFTDKNSSGHPLEVEVSPGVYVSFLRGGIGDLVKYASNFQQSGPLKGTAQFLQGKLAPLARTAIGAFAGTQYTGQPISPAPKKNTTGFLSNKAIKNTADYAAYITKSAGPLPFGISNLSNFLANKNKSILGGASLLTGLGRYAPYNKRTATTKSGKNLFSD